MLEAIGSLTALGVTLGGALGIAARHLKVEGNPLVEEIDGMMPGTNCGQCGLPGCSAAAEALVKGEVPVTMCPPGGKALAASLAAKLGVSLDLSAMEEKAPTVAFINEALCVGCTRCFKRCPTDAVVGGPKQIHIVVGDACTGCEKCVDVCPTECVEMKVVPTTLQTWIWPRPAVELADGFTSLPDPEQREKEAA